MKSVVIHLEDKEHELLSKQKGGITWRDALRIGCEEAQK